MRRELCTLSEVELGDLNFGVNCISKSGFSLLILKRKDGTLQACENLCKHQGGKFALSSDIEDAGKNIVKCTRHHWKLDCETLQYVNPLKHTIKNLFSSVTTETARPHYRNTLLHRLG